MAFGFKRVRVIRPDEELMIARSVARLTGLNKKSAG
jgi:acetate kinase